MSIQAFEQWRLCCSTKSFMYRMESKMSMILQNINKQYMCYTNNTNYYKRRQKQKKKTLNEDGNMLIYSTILITAGFNGLIYSSDLS